MWTRVVILIFFSAAASSAFQLFDHNGWIPVTNEIIINQIRRETIQSPRHTKADDIGIEAGELAVPYLRTEDNLPDEDVAGVKCRQDSFSEVKNKQYQDKPKLDNYAENFHPSNNYDKVNTLRRSKKLADSDSRNLPNSLIHNTEPEFKDEQNNFVTSEKKLDVTNKYEVTEEITAEDTNQKETEFNKVEHEYPARKPNFTNGLIKYLSKYNINHNDNLQNYALSRRTKAVYHGKPNREDKTVHFRVPIRYNSLNHLSVDPLLAVFLSNYGYYIQGQYGIQNKYNNLYGYLASNNMHNNIPFGAYKLFSDTDSSQ